MDLVVVVTDPWMSDVSSPLLRIGLSSCFHMITVPPDASSPLRTETKRNASLGERGECAV